MLDSDTGAAGHGLMAIAADNAVARTGADLPGAADARPRGCASGLKIIFAVDTLEYLRRGGRIGGAQAWIGSTLKIKPILSIEPRDPADRARAHRRAARSSAWSSTWQRAHEDGADVFFIQHIQAPDRPSGWPSAAARSTGAPPEFVSEIGPVIGAHVGPGLFGVTGLPGSILGPV